jgi:DNA-binding response OmpR family regulator
VTAGSPVGPVLVVEDEPKIAEVVASYLRRQGREPVSVATGSAALEAAERVTPSLVILDLMLPDLPGEEVCRRLRRRSRVPIIMLTAKAEDADAIAGLDLGADDYVTKPFSPRQLMARVEAVLRRSAGEGRAQARRLAFGDLELEGRTGEVYRGGEPLELTPSERRLLLVLAANPGRVYSRAELIERALGPEFDGFDRTVDAHIKNLRQKIEPHPGEPRYVQTVHGLGYRFARE